MNARSTLTRAKWLIGCAVASIAIGAHAQSGPSADTLLRDSDAVLKQVDDGQFDAVWTNAAPFMKARFRKDQFAADTQRARQTVGSISHRDWMQITRVHSVNGTTAPDGSYANVVYTTTLTNGDTMFEKLSFRLEDGQWRLTGYVPYKSPNGTP
jgi:hypothetical protein